VVETAGVPLAPEEEEDEEEDSLPEDDTKKITGVDSQTKEVRSSITK
jgi:hypothetical protein